MVPIQSVPQREFGHRSSGREQLALVVDESKYTGHQGKRMRRDHSLGEVGLKQGALKDIEPPGGLVAES
jgi:hypothetical protein